MTAILCENLCKTYKGEQTPALDNFSLIVPENSVFGFLGPNGAGKTTTIKILTALMKADSGRAIVAGHEVRRGNEKLHQDIGYLGQEPHLYGWMKGRELLCFVGELFNLPKKEINSRADYLLELSGLKEAENKKVSAYSGGMLQRLGIAQAIMGKPKVLFLDEPTSSLDPIGRKEVLEFIQTLAHDCTVFMSTHILADVERVCSDVAIINKGKLILEGKTAELRKKYASGKVEVEFEQEEEAADFYKICKDQLKGTIQLTGKLAIYNPRDISLEKPLINHIIADNSFDIIRVEWSNATLEDIFVDLIANDH